MRIRIYILVLAVVFAPHVAWADEDAVDDTAAQLQENQEAIAAKKQQIAELNAAIGALEQQQAGAEQEEQIISKKLSAIKQQLAAAELELRQTQLSIKQVRADREQTTLDIEELQKDIEQRRLALAELLRELYLHEQITMLDVFLRTGSLADVLAERSALAELQGRSVAVVLQLQQEEQVLLEQEEQLEVQEVDLGQLQEQLDAQQAELAGKRGEQQEFLAANKEQQLRYEQKIAEAQKARTEIKQGLFQLQGAGVKLSLTEATDMAKLAGKFTGVRPALLLGVLKIESNVGGNIGNGVFPDDMHPQSREPFLRIMKKLGRDPNTAPISAARSYGWGGAMGPAQIMPATWEGVEARVAEYLGKPLADPYELMDAFVGTSVILGSYGAFDPAREREAAGRYLAGPNWQRYPWYIDRVMAVAAEYEKEL